MALESRAVAAAEDGKLAEARALLDELCATAPARASSFNNRCVGVGGGGGGME
jgi:hypothetical protein